MKTITTTTKEISVTGNELITAILKEFNIEDNFDSIVIEDNRFYEGDNSGTLKLSKQNYNDYSIIITKKEQSER